MASNYVVPHLRGAAFTWCSTYVAPAFTWPNLRGFLTWFFYVVCRTVGQAAASAHVGGPGVPASTTGAAVTAGARHGTVSVGHADKDTAPAAKNGSGHCGASSEEGHDSGPTCGEESDRLSALNVSVSGKHARRS